ncbi:MAG: tRNA 2-thiouridine(34) synthase MnmA [Clostridia bacterium]|nr:tRNA 2-thiouridine(34) synthase MnmA [Clostridia bacterium]
MIKVAIGLSGGVDSTAAAALLKEEGLSLVGVCLKMHAGGDTFAAQKAAEELGIPYHEVDLTARFEEQVLRPFAALYKIGETPNPCILCNPAVKFAGLLEAADALGCEKIATGHYASVAEYQGRHLIKRIPRQKKDQSYMLYGLGEEVLSRLLLPLGAFEEKDQVRAFADERGYSSADAKDSMDLCFLDPEENHADFIKAYTGSAPACGKICTKEGKILGDHKGICHYTVGQRRGLGVAAEQRLYVTALRPKSNQVILGPREDVMEHRVLLRDTCWHLPLPEEGLTAKVRYRDQDAPVRVELLEGDRAILRFESPKFAPAAGQSAVVYWENFLLGGGIIFNEES